ncbi:ATP-binding cassette domain-containing protein [Stagnimonas aquatica]|uniref:ATP-binding cassette domain-containing protein n=1 Tax=Stagnimonas aquatica TaxID=2689987 RepID=A0A3N0VII4_9GAMM|nr:polysaccharide ABC transporter ATP-binding protein [Stagnimonas aquatica]ROH92028.1 ATP-binding cassette domain-containing protein [Stagnimonas aquatica]
MSDYALKVEDLSKCFRVGAVRKGNPQTLVAQTAEAGLRALRRLSGRVSAEEKAATEHWALRDLNLEVKEGEVVGVIGHNGSGKSTLLKILSRITAPSTGRVRVRGRMASLLEVGTGFHPDLSGRENVFLNAAILGLKRAETRRRFDAIVEFSGVGRFIDTPVRNYSSGMKVRLGFAVAAHLDPDVLLIDEVLAVGDAAFQQRCLERIEQVGAAGRTILFVSHQLGAVSRLAPRSVLLNRGRIAFDGPTLTAIRHYEEHIGGFQSQQRWDDPAQAPGDDCVRLRAVQLTSDGKPLSGPVDVRRPLELRLRYEVFKAGLPILPSLHLYDFSGTPVLSAIDNHPEWHGQSRGAGVYETVAVFPGNLFNEGSFQLAVGLSTLDPFLSHAYVHHALAFSLYDPIEGDSTRGQYRGELQGYMRPALDWQTARLGA